MTDYLFLANEPTIDFVNTEVVLRGTRTDLLRNFESLTEWLAKAGLATAAAAQRLATRWGKTNDGEAALRHALALRGSLREALEKIAESGKAPGAFAESLGGWLGETRSRTEVHLSNGRIQTMTQPVLEKPEDAMALVALAAAKFLSTAEYSNIHHCEGTDCILFFYDTSKNHSRRWCSMEFCGNRAKVTAFRKRA